MTGGLRRVAVAALGAGLVFGAARLAGPVGVEALLVSGGVAAIAAYATGRWPRRAPPPVAREDLPLDALARAFLDYVDAHWGELPEAAYPPLDRLRAAIETILPRVAALSAFDPALHELRNLLGTHMPGLIDAYLRVPKRSRGGEADRKLLGMLATIADRFDAMAEDAANDALADLEVHARFVASRFGEGGGP